MLTAEYFHKFRYHTQQEIIFNLDLDNMLVFQTTIRNHYYNILEFVPHVFIHILYIFMTFKTLFPLRWKLMQNLNILQFYTLKYNNYSIKLISWRVSDGMHLTEEIIFGTFLLLYSQKCIFCLHPVYTLRIRLVNIAMVLCYLTQRENRKNLKRDSNICCANYHKI